MVVMVLVVVYGCNADVGVIMPGGHFDAIAGTDLCGTHYRSLVREVGRER